MTQQCLEMDGFNFESQRSSSGVLAECVKWPILLLALRHIEQYLNNTFGGLLKCKACERKKKSEAEWSGLCRCLH